MVPNGWKRKPLAKVAEIRTGVAKGKKNLKDPIEVPYLRVANVQDGYIDLTEIKTIFIERHQLEKYALKIGDVLMTEGGDFDKLGRGDVWQGQIEPCINQNHVFAVRTNSEILLPYFLSSLSASYYGKSYFLSCAKRSTNLASINSTQLKEFPILLPPLPEQQKIAKILTTWDKAISTTERLIDNSKQQKKALMQQLLTGKKRLLDKNGKPFEGEWINLKVEEIGEIVTGSTPPKNDPTNYGNDISWATADDFKQKYIFNTNVKLSLSGAKKARLVPKGSVLVTCIASIGKNAIADEQLATNQQINSVVVNKQHSNEFFYYLIGFYKHKLVAWAGTTAVPILNKTSFGKLSFNFPPLEEQQKIAAVLTNADKEIELLEQQLADLQQEKKALMQVLLTGKVRVGVDG